MVKLYALGLFLLKCNAVPWKMESKYYIHCTYCCLSQLELSQLNGVSYMSLRSPTYMYVQNPKIILVWLV